MIPYDPSVPFAEHFDMFRVPSNMTEAVEQYRLDLLHGLMSSNGIDNSFFSDLLNGEPSSPVFLTRFDPLAYFADISMSNVRPGNLATLPPVPATLADRDLILAPAVWSTETLPRGIRTAGDQAVQLFARLVSASMLDFGYTPGSRSDALRYISTSSVLHPAAACLRARHTDWAKHCRRLEIPDMVSTRLADFVKLFAVHGQPLEDRELVCLTSQELASSAYSLRHYVIERNRHTAFCNACMAEMLRLNLLAAIADEQLRVF